MRTVGTVLFAFLATTCFCQILTEEQLVQGNYQHVDINVNSYEMVIQEVDIMPMYPGGRKGMERDLYSNVRYPAEARRRGLQGNVWIVFDVDIDGLVTNVRAYPDGKPVDQLLKDAALEGLKNLKQWQPAYENGIAKRTTIAHSVSFRLE